MALSIKNEEAERLARQVAEEAGESITKAIEQSLRERLQRLRQRRRTSSLPGTLQDILQRVDALPNLDPRTAEEILGYDEHGIASLMVIDTSALLAIFLGEPERESVSELDPGSRHSFDFGCQPSGDRNRSGGEAWRGGGA